MVTNNELAWTFAHAREYIKSGESTYICDALHSAFDNKKIPGECLVSALAIVNERIDGAFSLEWWLARQLDCSPQDFKYCEMRTYRLAWLVMLTAEFSKKDLS